MPSYIYVILHFLGLSYTNLEAPPTIRSQYVALQPHVAPPYHPIVCTSVTCPVPSSPRQSVVLPVRLSSRQPPTSLSLTPKVSRTVHPSNGPSVHHPRLSVIQTIGPPSHHSVHDSSVHHPTHQSCATSVRPPVTIRPSAHHPTRSVRPSATVTPSVRHINQSVSMSVTGHLYDFHYNSCYQDYGTLGELIHHLMSLVIDLEH